MRDTQTQWPAPMPKRQKLKKVSSRVTVGQGQTKDWDLGFEAWDSPCAESWLKQFRSSQDVLGRNPLESSSISPPTGAEALCPPSELRLVGTLERSFLPLSDKVLSVPLEKREKKRCLLPKWSWEALRSCTQSCLQQCPKQRAQLLMGSGNGP